MPEPSARPIDRLLRPVQALFNHPLAGAGLLVLAATLALVWANSRWASSYHALLDAEITLTMGPWQLAKSVHHWINDGLMSVFFFLVGLEIKRELLAGELASVRKATLPAVAAVGGMLVPAAIYALATWGTPAVFGWGIPMATDIAFALGVLAIFGARVPSGLRVFLTALAIVDDIGAVLVIAVFYTSSISLVSLAVAAAFLALAVLFNRLQVRAPLAYFVVGGAAWLAFLSSGVHATVAAILMAMTIPARTRIDGATFARAIETQLGRLREVGLPERTILNTSAQQHVLESMETATGYASAPLQRLEHALGPVVTLVVLPLFALANAGIALHANPLELLGSPIVLGIAAGLFFGKQAGVLGAAYLAVRLRLADLPAAVSWRQVWAVGILAGIGFTMSLFIANLAFAQASEVEAAKVGIFSGTLVSTLVGSGMLAWALRNKAPA